jgi:hypothetical protein
MIRTISKPIQKAGTDSNKAASQIFVDVVIVFPLSMRRA